MKLKDVNEANFVSLLHGVEVAKMDKLIASKELTRPTEDTSKNDSTELSGTDKDHKKSTTHNSETVSNSDASFPTYAEVVIYKEREIVKNPLFRLEESPKVLDILIKDCFHVFESDENLDIFAYR